MVKKNGNENIPPLRGDDGAWALTSVEKAELFATAFQKKFHLPPSIENPNENIEQNDHEAFEDLMEQYEII